MLLSDKRIVEEVERGNIVIEPFDQRHLGTNSYDCRLGEYYFVGDANVEVMHHALNEEDEARLLAQCIWVEVNAVRTLSIKYSVDEADNML